MALKYLKNESQGDETSKNIFLTPPYFFLWKIDGFWLLFDPPKVRGNYIQEKVQKTLFYVVPLESNIFWSKSSQNPSIFHEKNDGGVKK